METTKELKDLIEKSGKKHLSNIDQLVDKAVEHSVLSLIGLEVRRGRPNEYEIDHCNGRNSVLIDAFRDRAKRQAEKLASQLKLDASEMKIYRDAFRREYGDQLRKAVVNAAKDRAKRDADELVAKIKIDVNKFLKI